MQTLHGDFVTEAGKALTRPIALLEIEYISGTVRYSDSGTITVLSETWASASFEIRSITDTTMSVEMDNTDLAQSSLILNNDVNDLPITLRAAYSDAPNDNEVVTVWTGFITGVSRMDLQAVVYDALNINEENAFLPRFHMHPPTFNHMPAPGSKLVWNGETLVF